MLSGRLFQLNIRFIIPLLLLLSSFATAGDKPFTTIRIALHGGENTNRELLHRYFKPSSAFGGSVSTPFYLGRVGLGATRLGFTGEDETLPDFDMTLLFIRWNLNQPMGPLMLTLESQLGNTLMKFEENLVYRGLGEVAESELHMGYGFRAALRVYKQVSLSASWRQITIFTRQRINLDFITVGVAVDFKTPDWLIDILK
ncbi:MAG: hypothetical protein AAFP70_10730 [Calditrichota bacterium]